MNTMTILLLIISVLLVFYSYRQNRHFKTIINNSNSNHEQERKLLEDEWRQKDNELKIQLRQAYEKTGDTIHYLHYIFEKGPCRYIPLLTEIGSYLRRMYLPYCTLPFSTLSDNYDLNPEHKNLPCLNEDENKQMLSFLKEIKDGQRQPADLLTLVTYLTDPEMTFKEAFMKTISLNKSKS